MKLDLRRAFLELRARAGARVRGRLRRQSADSRGEPWQCACGQRYLVAGRGRHKIFWLEGAAEGDPVLSGRCPNCDRALPA